MISPLPKRMVEGSASGMMFIVVLVAINPFSLHAAAGPYPVEADPNSMLVILYNLQQVPDPAQLTLNHSSGNQPLQFERIANYAVAAIPRTKLRHDGALNLALTETLSSPSTLGLYLLPGWPLDYVEGRNRSWFRRQALAAREYPEGRLSGSVTVDRFVPVTLEMSASGRLSALRVFGSNVLPEKSSHVPIWCGNQPAKFVKRVKQTNSQSSYEYRDPTNGRNRITVTTQPMADRVRMTLNYDVVQSIDRDVPVHFRIPLNQRLKELWEFGRPHGAIRDGARRFAFSQTEGADTLFSYMPLVFLNVARSESGQFVGVLDYDLSNLVVEARRTPGSDDFIQVSTYLWPREQGKQYRWSFELFTGFENRFSAILRSLEPFTKDNTEIFNGMLNRPGYFQFPSLKPAHEAGIRAFWRHGWYERNGKYFLNDRDPAEWYEAVWAYHMNYEILKRNVERAHKHGIQVYFYIQMAGVSEDMTELYASSLVRDRQGKQIVAGQDGRYLNIYCNPDPDGHYGKEILRQIKDLLLYTGADGVALDRADRMDWTYGSDNYDYGHFNGYSSIFEHDGARKPVSSITVEGRRWLLALRKMLDSIGRKFLTNSSMHLFVMRQVDGYMTEAAINPMQWFVARAMGNGKSYAITVHGRMNDVGNNLVANLIQAYPFNGAYPWMSFDEGHWQRLQQPQPLNADRPRGRLIYAISEGEEFPTLWYFNNGYTRLYLDEEYHNPRRRFRGSQFVPDVER